MTGSTPDDDARARQPTDVGVSVGFYIRAVIGSLAIFAALPMAIGIQRAFPPASEGERSSVESPGAPLETTRSGSPAPREARSVRIEPADMAVPSGGWSNGPAVVRVPGGSATGTVRALGKFGAPAVGELEPGTVVSIVGKSRDKVWCQIRWTADDGAVKEGWMHRDVLRPPRDPASVPQASVPSASAVPGDPDDVTPKSARAMGDKCFVHIKAEKYEQAKIACNVALTLNPDVWTHGAILYNLGLIAEKTGNTAEARGFYERSLEVRPDGVGVSTVRKALAALPP